jgi:hypothetical protein
MLADYLVYQYSIPILSVDGDIYWFTDNDLLQEVLKQIPFYIKLLSKVKL